MVSPDDPIVRIKLIDIVDVSELKPHPDNPNDHTDKQIKRLAEIISYQGWRLPIKVSNRSGYITAGHGRLMAAQLMGWSKVPVSYQDYDSEEMEYSDVIADNAIALWSEINLSQVNAKLPDLDGSELDIDLLGIEDFKLDLSELDLKDPEGSNDLMKSLKLMYSPDVYDHVVSRINELGAEHGIDDPSQLIAFILGVNDLDR